MSENEGGGFRLQWGQMTWLLAVLFAGFAGWLALDSRVTRLETKTADAELHAIPKKLERLEAGQEEILRRLDRQDRE